MFSFHSAVRVCGWKDRRFLPSSLLISHLARPQAGLGGRAREGRGQAGAAAAAAVAAAATALGVLLVDKVEEL